MNALTLTSRLGYRVTFDPLGAAIAGIFVPDRGGEVASITVDAGGSAGKTVGRYANRIAGGSFELDGTTFALATNEGRTTLHGGPDGFSKRTWEVEEASAAGMTFGLFSPDGDQGFPGALACRARYSWSDDNALEIAYSATTGKPTVINLTNHVYFNLSGDRSRPIAPYLLQLDAATYTPLDAESIPTGAVLPVDSLRDFRTERAVGTTAYDCMLLIDGAAGTLRRAGSLYDAESGREIIIETTQPGLQLFTGKPGAVALETQHCADAPHHPNFAGTVLRPGETFSETTIYRFGVRA